MASLATTAVASPCDDALNACDRALNDQLRRNQTQKLLIMDLEEANKIRQQIINDRDRELNKWYRDPFTVAGVTITVSAVAALYVYSQVRR